MSINEKCHAHNHIGFIIMDLDQLAPITEDTKHLIEKAKQNLNDARLILANQIFTKNE